VSRTTGKVHKVRVVTYNIHKCRGMDRRVRPERILTVLRDLEPDIVALQEVVAGTGNGARDQGRFLADALGLEYVLGENRKHRGAPYGNVTLSRFPVRAWRNYDISVPRRHRRGCLRVDLALSETQILHVFNVHLGTALLERRSQGRKLVDRDIVHSPDLVGPRIILGDFNEWTRGLTSRLLEQHFESIEIRAHLGKRRTYPGFFPITHLDHIYHDRALLLDQFALHRSRTAMIASDHLPLVAEFALSGTHGR
jgi:endonuclease/exonuclease/phosphatase family metal-dependent hydrolase